MLLLLAACARPPDLVLVTLDTTRRDAIGAYGGPPTPAIDGLAAEGVRYDHASTVVPLTIPAHASLMTGRWPTSTGVRDNGDHTLAAGETTLAEVLAGAGYDTGAAVGSQMVSPSWGFAQGFAWFDSPTTVERRGDAVVDAALGWLARDHGDKPLFLWVHLYDPHAPYDPPIPGGDPYLGEVAYADQQVGRLLDALRARPRWKDTGVVVVADHGEGRGDHGEEEHGALVFQATVGIPLVVRPPGGTAPRAEAATVSLVDLFPTLLGWASVPIPSGIDGQPLGGPSRPVFVESHYLARHLGWSPIEGMVEPDGSWMRTTRLRRFDAAEAPIPEPAPGGFTAPDGFTAHYAAPVATGTAPTADDLAALRALGYLDAAPGRAVPIDPIDGIAGYEALQQAADALAGSDLPRAAAALATARAVDPDGPAVRLLAVALLARTDPAAALPEAEALVRDAPSARAKAVLGELLAGSGRLREAVPHLRDAAKELPPTPRQMGLLGLALAETNDPDAVDLLQRALSADPDQPLLRGALGRLAAKTTSPESGIDWLTQEIERFPPAPAARKTLVEALLAAGRWSEALDAVNALEAVRPPDSGSAFARALALHHLGDDRGAARALAPCLAARPVPPVCAAAARGRW